MIRIIMKDEIGNTSNLYLQDIDIKQIAVSRGETIITPADIEKEIEEVREPYQFAKIILNTTSVQDIPYEAIVKNKKVIRSKKETVNDFIVVRDSAQIDYIKEWCEKKA